MNSGSRAGQGGASAVLTLGVKFKAVSKHSVLTIRFRAQVCILEVSYLQENCEDGTESSPHSVSPLLMLWISKVPLSQLMLL